MTKISLALCVALGWGTAEGYAATITLNPAADTTLFENNPDNNLGAESTLAVGTTVKGLKSRALLRFDVAGSLPSGATINSAALRFQVVRAPAFGAADSLFELRRVLVAWSEGTRSGLLGSPAGPGEPTWRARSAPDTLWVEPGGGAGIDFSSVASASTPVNGPGTYTVASTEALVADVQVWLDEPAQNSGWLLLSQPENILGTARRLASREQANSAPALIIDYSLSAAPLEIQSISIDRANAIGVITWSGGSPPYQLQISPSVDPPDWSNAGSLTETNRAVVVIEDAPASFFRVKEGAAASPE